MQHNFPAEIKELSELFTEHISITLNKKSRDNL